jgi:hypothetical protein
MTGAMAVDRPDMPAGYGLTDDLDGVLPWAWAERRLVESRNYWVATAGPDGAPHVAPVWGVWVDGALWFGTEPTSAKGRNLARDDRLVVHLESGEEVVIVHGRVTTVALDQLDPAIARAVDDAYAAKYVDPETDRPMRLSDSPEGSRFYRVAPGRCLGWLEHDFLRSRTRWRFVD